MSDDLRMLMAEQARLRKIVDEWLEVIELPTDGSEIVIPPRTREQTLAFLEASDALQRTEQAIAEFFGRSETDRRPQ
jgi:hypothetical protein